jgi:ubiquinone/menaquinone biosynthesis C-methylase UbiE
MSEHGRIAAAYARRQALGARYSLFDAATLRRVQQRERATLALLHAAGLDRLGAYRVLDVGCGSGGELVTFVRWGAWPTRLHGVDLLLDRLALARRRLPHARWLAAAGEALPFADATFDLVTQFTVFTSVLDAALRARIAAEMRRVLRPSGAIVWYDFWLPNPLNPDVRPVTRAELRRLFPGWRCVVRRLTLAPPLARALASRAPLLCALLERVPWLCTHDLALLQPPGRDRRGDEMPIRAARTSG